MIEARDLTKRYGSVQAVRGVSFSVTAGEVTGLLGPNGAGKTTVMKILTGYHFPSAGSASVAGFDVTTNPVAVKRNTGYLPESAPLYPELTVYDYLEFMARARRVAERRAAIERVIETAALSSVVYRPIEELSKGFRQRVGLAQAILHDPAVLILDEPTTGLDPNQIVEIRRIIVELGKQKTVILSTHILQEVEAVCDRVLIMHQGTIVAGGTTEEIGGRLKGHDVYRVRFKNAVDAPAFQGALRGCVGVTEPESRTGEHWLHVAMRRDADGAEQIFDWAVGSRNKILALEAERTTLEQVFQQLTAGEGTR